MTVKIVRTAVGEDVIADVKEAYPDRETYSPIGYVLTNPYTVTISATAEMLFEEGTTDDPQKINDLNLELFPWIPLSVNNNCLMQLHQVSTIYDPHPEVLAKYEKLTETHHNESTENSSPQGSQPPYGGTD
tara:strand:+ start:18 stop:410 length:393 start_codon:yes stop_codon:yes gene_type:complete